MLRLQRDKAVPMTHVVEQSWADARRSPLQRETITAAIIAKNEEARIRGCLDTLDWVDEIVVIDGMSTDRTVEICESYGAKVVRHAFEGAFCIERNLGHEHATSDWVLHLDADDVITGTFREQMLAVLATRDTRYDAYKFRRKSIMLGQTMEYGGWWHYIPNVVRRETVRYQGIVHERPMVPTEIGVIDADIEHRPFHSMDEFYPRQRRYTTLQALELMRECGRIPKHLVAWRMCYRPLKSFRKSYIKKQGFREGWNGFRFAVLYSWVEWLKWRKYWTLLQDTRTT
jgi:glycosyltransferase involved in cell wall biosynthesis